MCVVRLEQAIVPVYAEGNGSGTLNEGKQPARTMFSPSAEPLRYWIAPPGTVA